MNFEVSSQRGNGPPVVTVVGVGGCGVNAVTHMNACGVKDVAFIIVETDRQAIAHANAPMTIAIGEKLTRGLSAGGKPEIGASAALEDGERIASAVGGADMVIVTAGMGGGTGTGAAPVIAKIAREQGALTVAVVTRPFDFEGKVRQRRADEGLAKLRAAVDALFVVPTQHLFEPADGRTPITPSLAMTDDVLRWAIQGIADLVTSPPLTCTDFGDMKAAMAGHGDSRLGLGSGRGDNRAVAAATNAIHSPLFAGARLENARHILVTIAGGDDMALREVKEILTLVAATAAPDAGFIWGTVVDPSLGDTIRVTVIATGLR